MLAEKPPAARGSDETALFAHGLWMGLGFVGSSLLAGGVATYFVAPGLKLRCPLSRALCLPSSPGAVPARPFPVSTHRSPSDALTLR